ncbi:MAG: tRNA pseudouridine(38-40) synthase TruA [Candidatus Omnitrophica bacterium]|nr:tRNA pseudouridine(38-40) synthase TruA [Candidatus Omnitrophota bacterium]
MRNICLTIAYDGTHYAGWQVQRNARTIQGEIEKVLKRIYKKKVKLTGASRTDAGVHAEAQIANFKIESGIPPNKLQLALNSSLPDDISITSAKKVPLKFHAQFDAQKKLYRYSILNSRVDNPFLRRFYHKVPYKLDMPLMRKEAKAFKGNRDFKSFQAKNAFLERKSTIRKIERVAVRRTGDFVYIDIEADGFLRNMARNIVGTLIEIGRGYLPRGSASEILKRLDRRKAGPTAPAKGLVLIRVQY